MSELSLDAFTAGAAAEELRLPACRSCGHRWLPPVGACPNCRSSEVEWRAASGRGTVVASCVFHRPYFDDPDLPVPYVVLLVRLEEGPLFYANPVDLVSQPTGGTRVRAAFVRTGQGRNSIRFEPEGDPA